MSTSAEAPADALDAAVRIGRTLEAGGIAYAIGGALAYGQYGIPRATNDVDVNVFVGPDELAGVIARLGEIGIAFDAEKARQAAADEGLVVGRWGLFRIDLFTPSIAFSHEAARTRIPHVVDGVPVWFLSAEALTVFKLLFFRGKDIVDLERLVAVQGSALDTAYVRAKIIEMVGDDDPRVVAWDGLVGRPGASGEG